MHTTQHTFMGCTPPHPPSQSQHDHSCVQLLVPRSTICCWALVADAHLVVAEQGDRPSLNRLTCRLCQDRRVGYGISGPITLLSMSAAQQTHIMNVVQDAVVLALSFDMALASATANRPEEEPALKRNLWLTIARHIVHQHPSQDQACLHLLLTHDSLNATIATACSSAPGYSCKMSGLQLFLLVPCSWLSRLLLVVLSSHLLSQCR